MGNVLSTISDRKIGIKSATDSSLIAYYEPVIVSASEYYPFGMMMRQASASKYRFGFNGKENDNEVKGLGNQIDYDKRIYDPRLGRFLSVDPRQTKFPDLTPYQFAGNTPVQAIDLDGLEPQGFMETWKASTDPYMTKWGYTVQDFYDYKTNQTWTVMNYPNTNEYYYWETKYEKAEQLFKPYNTNLNKNDGNWTGLFRQFTPTHLSGDRSFHYLTAAVLVGIPALTIYGKAIAAYLFSEILEEAAGVPIPDGPVDLFKYKVKKEVAKEAVEEIEHTATVYRTQGGVLPNASQQRIKIADDGSISIEGDQMLYVTINDKDHQVYFYSKRGGSEKGASIASFEIPKSLADEIMNNAVPQKFGKQFPDKPQISDPTKSKSAFGLPKEYIEKLKQQAVQGSGKIQASND